MRQARREERAYWAYVSDEQRCQPGCSAGRMYRSIELTTLKALFMTVWCPDSRSVESNCGIPRG